MSNDNAVKMQLQQRLADLLPRVGRIEGDLRSAHDRDWPERANELQNDEVLEGLDEMALGEVRRIREALERIDGGNYGVCARCGQPIGAARLTAVPTAVTCVRCAVT
jgi:RNA polymerase-binding transcription factor DksA